MGVTPGDDEPPMSSIREALVILYLADVVDLAVLQAVVGRPDVEAVQAAASLVDEGDQLATEIAALEVHCGSVRVLTVAVVALDGALLDSGVTRFSGSGSPPLWPLNQGGRERLDCNGC